MASPTKLTSGIVFEGTDQSVSLATGLLQTINSNRCCAISIANATKCPLRNPKRYIHHGNIANMPEDITYQHTGLISVYKLTNALVGSSGVITYDIVGTFGDQKLQIMWRIPFDLNLFENCLNVCVGTDEASAELFQDMMNGLRGTLVVPNGNKPFVFPVIEFCFDIRVVMNESGRTPLAVFFGPYDMSPFYSFRIF